MLHMPINVFFFKAGAKAAGARAGTGVAPTAAWNRSRSGTPKQRRPPRARQGCGRRGAACGRPTLASGPKAQMDRAVRRSQSYLDWKNSPSCLRSHPMLTSPRSMSSASPASPRGDRRKRHAARGPPDRARGWAGRGKTGEASGQRWRSARPTGPRSRGSGRQRLATLSLSLSLSLLAPLFLGCLPIPSWGQSTPTPIPAPLTVLEGLADHG